MKKEKYQAGTFSNLQPFNTIKDARLHCNKLKKETSEEVRIIVSKTNKNILL